MNSIRDLKFRNPTKYKELSLRVQEVAYILKSLQEEEREHYTMEDILRNIQSYIYGRGKDTYYFPIVLKWKRGEYTIDEFVDIIKEKFKGHLKDLKEKMNNAHRHDFRQTQDNDYMCITCGHMSKDKEYKYSHRDIERAKNMASIKKKREKKDSIEYLRKTAKDFNVKYINSKSKKELEEIIREKKKEPKEYKTVYHTKKVAELREIAKDLGIKYPFKKKKAELLERILEIKKPNGFPDYGNGSEPVEEEEVFCVLDNEDEGEDEDEDDENDNDEDDNDEDDNDEDEDEDENENENEDDNDEDDEDEDGYEYETFVIDEDKDGYEYF